MKSIMKRIVSLTAMITMMLTMFVSLAQAAKEENVAPPGSSNFVSLANYITPTDIPDVYKVMMSIEAPYVDTKTEAVFVAVTLDASGSMLDDDIVDQNGLFNTTTRATDFGPPQVATSTDQMISGYEALELAVDALVKHLASTGNKNIYLNLSSHVRQSVFTTTGLAPAGSGGFVKIFDSNGNIIPELQYNDGMNPQWILKDWEYVYFVDPRDWDTGTPSIMEARWGGFNDNDVGMAFQLRNQEFEEGIRSGLIKENDSRYVLVMGDGDDDSMSVTGNMLGNGTAGATSSNHNYIPGTVNTQRFALGLKAPIDPNFLSNTPGVMNPIVGLNTVTENGTTTVKQMGGVGANIWGVIVGKDVLKYTNNNWKTDFVPSLNGARFSSLVEYSMISNTLVLPESYIIPSGIIGSNGMDDYINSIKSSLSSPLIQNSASPTDNTVNYYRSMSMEAGWIPPQPLYANKDPLLNVFANFGQTAVDAAGGGGDIEVVADLNMNPLPGHSFEFYDYPGIGKLELGTDDPSYNSSDPTDTIEMFAKIDNNTVIWNQNLMNGGYFYNLSFFLKYDGPGLDGQVFKLFNDAYIRYTRNDGTIVVKNFPMSYFDPSMNRDKDENKDKNIMTYTDNGTGIMMTANGLPAIGTPNDISGSISQGGGSGSQNDNGGTLLILPNNAIAINKSSQKRLKITKDQTIIYQKTTSGKYKAVAKVAKDKTFTVIDEDKDYYKILFMKKDAKKATVGYIKKTDASLI